MTPHDAVAVLLVLTCALALLIFLRFYRRRTGAEAEWVRKLAHIGTGGLSIALPWIFATSTPVFVLCGASVALLLAIRFVPFVHRRLTGVLDGVERESLGEICFPISVALLYQLSNGSKLLYAVPLLVLTLADTVAALTGAEYGKHSFAVGSERKSIEGSIGFFCAAFFSVHVILLVLTDAGRIESLLISLNIGILVMLLEAIAWRGLDNLIIPLSVFVLLRLYLNMSVTQLWDRFRVAAALVILVTAYGRRTTLQGSALLASVLVLYVSWSVGGWQWLLPPTLLLLTYALFFPGKITAADRTHTVYAVVSVASTGLVWLFLSIVRHEPKLFFPYTVAYAAHLAIVAWNVLHPRFVSSRGLMYLVSPLAWLLMFLPYVAFEKVSRDSLEQAGLGLLLVAIAFGFFFYVEPKQDGIYPASTDRWLRQAAIVMLATIAAWLV
jgi:phytol kinase